MEGSGPVARRTSVPGLVRGPETDSNGKNILPGVKAVQAAHRGQAGHHRAGGPQGPGGPQGQGGPQGPGGP